jgi:hypothetical protein
MLETVFEPFRHEVYPLTAGLQKGHAHGWKLIEDAPHRCLGGRKKTERDRPEF